MSKNLIEQWEITFCEKSNFRMQFVYLHLHVFHMSKFDCKLFVLNCFFSAFMPCKYVINIKVIKSFKFIKYDVIWTIILSNEIYIKISPKLESYVKISLDCIHIRMMHKNMMINFKSLASLYSRTLRSVQLVESHWMHNR